MPYRALARPLRSPSHVGPHLSATSPGACPLAGPSHVPTFKQKCKMLQPRARTLPSALVPSGRDEPPPRERRCPQGHQTWEHHAADGGRWAEHL